MKKYFFKVFNYFFQAGTSNEWKIWKMLASKMHISSWQVELTGRRQMLWYPWKCNGLWSSVARTSTVPWDLLQLFCEYVSPIAFLKCCWMQASNLREALDTSQAPPGMNSGSFPYLVAAHKNIGVLSLVAKRTTKHWTPHPNTNDQKYKVQVKDKFPSTNCAADTRQGCMRKISTCEPAVHVEARSGQLAGDGLGAKQDPEHHNHHNARW